MRKRTLDPILVIVFFALMSLAAFAQNNAAPSQTPVPTTVIRSTSRLVIVDVVARTSRGEPVTDLKATDFSLEEDGHLQEIRSFSFMPLGGEPEVVPASATIPPVPGSVNNFPVARPKGALNILLLDTLNSTTVNQASMRDSMLKALAKLPANQPVAVYVLGGRLRLMQDFTSDPALLKAAITGTKVQASNFLDNPNGTAPTLDIPPGIAAADLLSITPGLGAQIQAFRNEQISSQTDVRLRYTLEALGSLARTLAGYPGRKNLIWLSETFPFSIESLDPTNVKQGQRNYAAEITRTGTLLSDAQVAVYPVDARGMVNNSLYSVGSDPNPMNGAKAGDSTFRGEVGASINADSDQQMAARTTMKELAEKTGGKAFYNRSDLDKAVTESMNDGSSYFSLGYYPTNKDWNGSFRKIQVKVNRPGVKIHYRLGYLAIDREAFAKLSPANQDRELDQALSLEWPVSTGLPFQAEVLAPSAQTQGKVTVRYKIDSHALNFIPVENGLQSISVLCATRVFSIRDLNKPFKTDGNRMAGALKPEVYTRVVNTFVPCQEQFDLPPGDYILRLGVRDNTTGVIGTSNAKLTVTVAVDTVDEKKPQ